MVDAILYSILGVITLLGAIGGIAAAIALAKSGYHG